MKDGDQTSYKELYVKGFKATYIDTDHQYINMGLDNHAFIHEGQGDPMTYKTF